MPSLIAQFITEDLQTKRQVKDNFQQKCTNKKKKYARKDSAWKGVEKLKLYIIDQGLESWRDEYLHPYHCNTCQYWHIGHSDSLHRMTT